MQGHEAFVRKIMEQCLWQKVHMKMNNIELVSAPPHLA